MTTRHASCSCGQLRATCVGDPVRISICHCLECQRRTGSTFGVQARFRIDQVTIGGEASRFERSADSGNSITFHFCPTCGATLHWQVSAAPDVIAIAVGAFADPTFPAPRVSVYERRRHPWITVPGHIERIE